ncbi:MAG TPA: hypothetical protein DCZ43_11985 [candidate division Zixibacteria bacterium]|nr:hypothetical protein [candidate division Zixibacteria bacterium]
MKAKPKSQLPTSGRVGRFAQFLIAIGGESAAKKIAMGIEGYDKLKPVEKAAWWDSTMVRMEKALGRDKAIEVMQSCGQKCCGAQTRSKAKTLFAKSSSIADFLTKLNNTGMGGGQLTQINDNTIKGKYNKCYCGQVASATKQFATDIYCQCSRAWLEQYFSSIFDRPVAVKMDKTIREGAATCEFTVRLQ